MIATLNHRDSGKVAFDPGATQATGINAGKLYRLRKLLGRDDEQHRLRHPDEQGHLAPAVPGPLLSPLPQGQRLGAPEHRLEDSTAAAPSPTSSATWRTAASIA